MLTLFHIVSHFQHTVPHPNWQPSSGQSPRLPSAGFTSHRISLKRPHPSSCNRTHASCQRNSMAKKWQNPNWQPTAPTSDRDISQKGWTGWTSRSPVVSLSSVMLLCYGICLLSCHKISGSQRINQSTNQPANQQTNKQTNGSNHHES